MLRTVVVVVVVGAGVVVVVVVVEAVVRLVVGAGVVVVVVVVEAFSAGCSSAAGATQRPPIILVGLVHWQRPKRFGMRKSQWVRVSNIWQWAWL